MTDCFWVLSASEWKWLNVYAQSVIILYSIFLFFLSLIFYGESRSVFLFLFPCFPWIGAPALQKAPWSNRWRFRHLDITTWTSWAQDYPRVSSLTSWHEEMMPWLLCTFPYSVQKPHTCEYNVCPLCQTSTSKEPKMLGLQGSHSLYHSIESCQMWKNTRCFSIKTAETSCRDPAKQRCHFHKQNANCCSNPLPHLNQLNLQLIVSSVYTSCKIQLWNAVRSSETLYS